MQITGSVRRRIAVTALALLVPVTAACGFNAQTDAVYQPAVGSNVRAGMVDVLGGVVVSSTPGSGVFLATLSNENPNASDTFTGIQGQSGINIAVPGAVKIPPAGVVNLADAAYGRGLPVQGSRINAVKSNYISFQLTFSRADPVTISVPVVPADGPYANFDQPTSPSSPNSVATEGSQGAFSTPAG